MGSVESLGYAEQGLSRKKVPSRENDPSGDKGLRRLIREQTHIREKRLGREQEHGREKGPDRENELSRE